MTSKILPAEWHPQSAVMLTWPHEYRWEEILAEMDETFANITAALINHVDIIISATSEWHQDYITNYLLEKNISLERIHIYLAANEDIWVRDYGPLTIFENDQAILLKFPFNGWGDKYPADQDDQLVLRLQEQHAFGNTFLDEINFIFEGGGIESNGEGTVMLTRHWLHSRHPNLSSAQLEEKLKLYFGATHILWLDHGYLAGDDTDSHIDTLARFVNPTTITYVQCDDKNDEHFDAFEKMEQDLKNFRTPDDKPYQLIPLPWPKKVFSEFQQKRLPASYANFLITNGAVLVPTYENSADNIALKQLASAFPHHEIIPINCRYMVEYYGSLHCATMQLPEGII